MIGLLSKGRIHSSNETPTNKFMNKWVHRGASTNGSFLLEKFLRGMEIFQCLFSSMEEIIAIK